MFHTLLIHQGFVSPKEAGGTRHYEFARYITKRGNKFTVVASTRNYLSGKMTTAQVEGDLDGIMVLRAHTPSAHHKSFVWRVYGFLVFMLSSLWKALRVPSLDIIMGTSPPIFQAGSALVIAKLKRKPFLLEVRDLWPEFAIDMGVLKSVFLIKISRWFENFLYRNADHLLVNSPAYKTYLIEYGVPEHKVSFIPNGVDPEMFNTQGDASRYRKIWGIEEKFAVVYAGALGPANDIPTILQAAAKIQDTSNVFFVFVGDGKERTRSEALTATLNLKNVKFVGGLPKSEMADVLAAADVTIATLQNIPMFTTTYPNKVFDYLAAGKPIIFNIDGVIREVVEKADAGLFVPPGDSDALAKAILTLEHKQGELTEMGQRGKQYVAKNFNRNDHAKAFLALLNKLAQRRT
ncbi:MAG: glycosyltransferase family 4 protein [Bacteroidetes Order II. Incertae sedis bacterium]|nr:glycosyltransferase family 4 protein [Bacteroidetes Order II. bacterium]